MTEQEKAKRELFALLFLPKMSTKRLTYKPKPLRRSLILHSKTRNVHSASWNVHFRIWNKEVSKLLTVYLQAMRVFEAEFGTFNAYPLI